MIDRGLRSLHDAYEAAQAIGAFSIYNLEGLLGVIAAAAAANRPVIVQVGSSAFDYAPLDVLAAMALAAAERAEVPVGVHLDHSRDLVEVGRCLELGYSSVMFDGSHLPFDENVMATREAAALAHSYGAWIEGELGEIGGDEDRSGAAATSQSFTDPVAAAEFVAATGVDALAVAVGNVHGVPPPGARLALDRLEAIAAACPVPLVLHGASGVPDDDLRRAIQLGVAKLNVNTELRIALLDELAASDPASTGYSLPATMAPARAAVAAVVAGRIACFTEPPGDAELRGRAGGPPG